MNKFDSVVTGAFDIAQNEILKRKNVEFYPEHLLYGLIKNPSSFSFKGLKRYLEQVEEALQKIPLSSREISFDEIRPSPSLSSWITKASARAIESSRQEIIESDLLRFLPEVFPFLPINYDELKKVEEESSLEVPDFLVDLCDLALKGKLDPVIGRSKEIRSVMEILGRRQKNNPVLVGSAGVGKTAIVEGLAGLIVKDQVPDQLKNRIIYSLNMGALMAGTKFRGEFEERIVSLLKFIKEKQGEAILFIDELHLLVGAGKTEGAMDAANLLKPALSRGELHCIGATTQEEYEKYILNDSALDRRFRSVTISDPTHEDAIEILMGLKEKQEIHHGIKISDEAIYQAVLLSDQYITDKHLPDKAIDLIDEASSALKLSTEAMPAYLIELEGEIRSKMILAQIEKDNKEILEDIARLKERFNEGKRLFDQEVLALKKVSLLKDRLDRLRFDLETHQRKQNYEEASKIKYLLIPEVEKELAQYQHGQILKTEHIAEIVARHTGIPVEKILKSKQDKILELEKNLNERVFGQEKSIHEIAQALMTAHAGLSDAKRPLGSFLLLGPTGVGKTETVKAVSQFLFNSEKNMIRFDMSEYSEKHAVAKLIGAPAGYVGYDDGGTLTRAIRNKPYAVILFDEIEKAHGDFSDILLQILDDGRLTDNKGRTVNFKNTIIFMTSNSQNIQSDFKPEVLGRIDEILHYNPLNSSVMERLIERELFLLNEKLRSKKIVITLSETTKKRLLEEGYLVDYGARPLKTLFNRVITRPLAYKLTQNLLPEGEYCV